MAAAVLVVVLVAVGGRYGYHRDELYFLEGGHHLAWAQPDNPPLVPLLAYGWDALVGHHLTAFRVLPALAAGVTVLVAALTCRQLGGTSRHQTTAAVATASSSIVVGTGHLFSTTTFDLTLTSVALLLLVRALAAPASLLRWGQLGVVTGVALEVKTLPALVGASALVGLLVLGPRGVLRRRGPGLAAVLALVLAAPDLIWQGGYGWPMLDVATTISQGGSASSASRALLVPLSLLLIGPVVAVVAVAGLVRVLRPAERHRLGWVAVGYLVLLGVLLVSGGKPYYLAGYFPTLFALGAGPVADWAGRSRRRTVLCWVAVAVSAVPTSLFALPLAPVGSAAFGVAAAVDPDGAETVGWPGYVAQVRAVAATLSPAERADTVILTRNYGEAGALARARRLSPADGALLPPVYSGHNAFGLWGPPPAAATEVVVVGDFSDAELASWFAGCRQVGALSSPAGVDNEELGAPIRRCAGLRAAWSQLWPRVQRLG